LPLLRSDCVDLISRFPFGQNRVEIKGSTDRLCGIGTIAGHHDYARHADSS
jgi:hypothetical protein